VERGQVERLRAGEAQAFDAAYAEYHRRIYAFLFRLAGRRDLAEDLFQETWMKLARSATTLAEDTDLGAWLYTVARNAYRSHRRWVLIDLDRKRQQIEAAEKSDAPSVEGRADARRELLDLERANAKLPDAEREVLLLVTVEGIEQERAAQILGIGYDALRQRLSRARAKLSAHLPKQETGT
jgi:RNA polymerase sigma-70 factor (ECF subfamily)